VFPEGTGWRKQTICLDRAYAGRPQLIPLIMDGGDGMCTGFGGTERAFFDDAPVTTVPSGPDRAPRPGHPVAAAGGSG
jgi:hypothetical protein